MKPCTKAVYVSLIRRRDSAAIVSNTSELLPEPDTPVKTVSFRLGMSRSTSWRLFSRAPRILMAPQSDAPSLLMDGPWYWRRSDRRPRRTRCLDGLDGQGVHR